ncbi:peptidoglycan-binding protein [Streptomyces sp. ST2-7A]|uniref:peptidoglycan-binding domain-containing protein n=1 Tax=Streptomyces sp. ST2-7A TaxID=2907214 RepID=UPI001F3B7874|nr:peptidoglycan-binding domain-containing protein [Streptomyces sp. ST2-7A]MCE7080381.1 peptidoglycan-binding protein [Streptomyces sp. ST2-7A]
MKVKKHLAATLAAVAVLSGLGVTTASTAHADNPCAKASWYTLRNGDRAPLPAASGGSFSCVMGRGAGGEHVKALQWSLNRCEGARLDVDGVFGPATESALRTARSRNGVASDGVYGPNTRNAMRWEIRRSSGSTYCGRPG